MGSEKSIVFARTKEGRMRIALITDQNDIIPIIENVEDLDLGDDNTRSEIIGVIAGAIDVAEGLTKSE